MEKSHFEKFNDLWLFESPMISDIPGNDTYTELVYGLKLNTDNGLKPVTIGGGLMALFINESTMYCWHGDENNIDIICILNRFDKGYAISIVGKSKSSSIYASDFYELILSRLHSDLLFSGNILNMLSIKTWDRLLINGNHIFIYDPTNPKKFKKVSSPVELNDFLGGEDYKKFRYVLSKNMNILESEFVINKIYRLTFNL